MRRQLFFEKSSYTQLTPRETTVLSAAKNNEPVSEIASTLDVPQAIIFRHLINIVDKLNNSDEKLAHQLTFAYNIAQNA